MKPIVSLLVPLLMACASASADEAACEKIQAANRKTFDSSDVMAMRKSGYDFSHDTPKIFALGTQTCSHLRDESSNGEAVEVYSEQYKSETGQTDQTIWISKATGRTVREEQDGDITGKGKGHISYTWAPRKP
jgi:hypothetical protein